MLSRLEKREGVTLVEVLIALTILLIVFLGLIQAALLSIQHNMRNSLRDEAVAITSEQTARLKSTTYVDINRDGATDAATLSPADFNSVPFPNTITRQFRNAVPVVFTIARTVTTLDTDNKQITVTTTWGWQGENFTHEVMTTRRR